MRVYPEMDRITEFNLYRDLSEKTGYNALLWEDAYFVDGCKELSGHLYKDGGQLDNKGMLNGGCYCLRHPNLYIEDEFHGILYFKTAVPGRFAAIPFVD